jgi:hypothetical protein
MYCDTETSRHHHTKLIYCYVNLLIQPEATTAYKKDRLNHDHALGLQVTPSYPQSPQFHVFTDTMQSSETRLDWF